MKLFLVLFRLYIQGFSLLFPKRAGKYALDLFCTPRLRKLKPSEKTFYQQAIPLHIPFRNEAITAYEIGNPNGKLVFLVHGWESNAGSMAGIAKILTDLNYRVILFDLPGHQHAFQKRTNLFMASAYFQRLIEYVAPQASFSVVSHSFGSAITSYVLSKQDYPIDQLLFLTAPNKMTDLIKYFKETIKLGKLAHASMLSHFKETFGMEASRIVIAEMGESINYQKFSMIHCRKDSMLPFSNAEEICRKFKNASLIEIKNTGHYSMLWNQDVLGLINQIFKQNQLQKTQKGEQVRALIP